VGIVLSFWAAKREVRERERERESLSVREGEKEE
jgi:hypothetical protein